MYLENNDYCSTCEYYDECEDANQVNFCDDCRDCILCSIRWEQCKAGHDIECNNGFEPKSMDDWEDEDEDF